MTLALVLAFAAVPQSPDRSPEAAAAESVGTPIVVALAPGGEDSAVRLRWSPKGAAVALAADGDDARTGSLPLGPAGTPHVAVRIERSEGSEHFDRLLLDSDRDGTLAEDELLTCVPKLTRNKWWSSFPPTTVQVPVPAEDGDEGAASRPYELSLWFVVDPREEAPWPDLRWSRRGWHEGRCSIDGEPAYVLITEANMDGVFSTDDAWMLAREPGELGKSHRSLGSHCWLDGQAYRVAGLDPHGRRVTLEAFDPGFTQEEELARRDRGPSDADAPRAETPLAFGHDLAAALAEAKENGTKVFVDFETTWCGPCKAMDRDVYPSQAVVEAARGAKVVCVKLDGDDEFDLVKKYEVSGYPTMLLLDADGKVLKREVGYRSIGQMVKFFGE